MNNLELNTFAEKIKKVPPDQWPAPWLSYARMAQYRLPYQKSQQYKAGIKKVLDWGCGNGHFSFFLCEQGFETIGYSYEAEPAYLSSLPNFKFAKGATDNPSRLPFADHEFDAVFSIGVLEHVHDLGGDQQRSVDEIFRILKPGAIFFIFHLPNKYTWIEFFVRLINRTFKLSLHQHTKLYTNKSLLELLKGKNFKLLEKGRYNILPRNIMDRLPKDINQNKAIVNALDGLDDFLSLTFPLFCQNWYFIIQKT